MKRLMASSGLVVLLLSAKSYAQSGAAIPPADAGHVAQASCVIVKRMGSVDRLYSLGISGKRFRYVEGKLPEGFSSPGKMTDHDVLNLQARGAEVLVLDSHYTSKDLENARSKCQGETGTTPNQAEGNAPPAPAPAPLASTPVPAPKPPTAEALKADHSAPYMDTTDAALVDISSTPTGADVYIDDLFFGRTPSTTIILEPGDHKIAIKKDGFEVWKKKLKLPSGRINVDAELFPKAK